MYTIPNLKMHEIELLNDEQLNYINEHFKYMKFSDGRISNPGAVKVCETVFDGPGNIHMNEYCRSIIEEASLPIKPFLISQIYFVKYAVGGQYENHYDADICGGVRSDYSMTCFLSDDYEGGELIITANDGKETEVKLSKGKAILYQGDLLHRVNTVTSGRRDVFVCWIEV